MYNLYAFASYLYRDTPTRQHIHQTTQARRRQATQA
jgi:hypothetical protein